MVDENGVVITLTKSNNEKTFGEELREFIFKGTESTRTGEAFGWMMDNNQA